MQWKFKWWESTAKDVTARSQGASRSIASASKPMFCALKTVNARSVKILKEAKKEGLSFMQTIMQYPTSNRQLMQPLMGLLEPLVMGPLRCPLRENVMNTFSGWEPKINPFT
jgi:hypothetical protein